jgi:hypothetical protein
MTANVTSVRLQILEAIQAKFEAMTEAGGNGALDASTSDPYGIKWSTVGLGPIVKFDNKKRYSLGIAPGSESEKFQFPLVECRMRVNIEFRVTVNRDDDSPGIMLEQALTVVKRALVADRTWGGIAIDTKIINSENDLITYADRSAMGVCVAEIQYRYNYNDPRTPWASPTPAP